MTGWVSVENYKRLPVGDAGRDYRPIVGWSERREYPMLAHVDSMGMTFFNRDQTETLDDELVRIQSLIEQLGPAAALKQLNAVSPDLDAFEIHGWDTERDFAQLVSDLRGLCAIVRQKPHRYLVFSGD